ncbi:hypothetical protein HD806DRAFT_534428 [Xylariaceae sp. AK1471]|nr:hypothetical protein HD806DRAFT_534428 [Xylariaceae sp. AK1471]
MCQDIQKVTYFCGHQASFLWGKSRFCLFTGAPAERFHTTYVYFLHNEGMCPRCHIGDRVKAQGQKMKRFEFVKAVNDKYVNSPDWYAEEDAKKFESLTQKTRAELTAAKIEDLNQQVKEQIVFHLGKKKTDDQGVTVTGLAFGAKVVMLRQITTLPEDVFDRKALVKFFASQCDVARTFSVSERKKLERVAHKARLDITFKTGLASAPIPLPVRRQEKKLEEIPAAAEGLTA